MSCRTGSTIAAPAGDPALATTGTGRTAAGERSVRTPRTSRTAAGIMAAALMLTSACASTPDPAADRLTGCYYFERSDVAQRLRLPWGVRLVADTIGGWPALQRRSGVQRAVTLVAPGEEAAHPFGYWLPLAGDSVEIGYPAGGGLLLVVAAGPTHLTGTVTPVGDALPPGAEDPHPRAEPVRLLRARCP